jgi:hypothetical protein
VTSRAWVLNLDADLELAAYGAGAYTPSRSVRAAMSVHLEPLRRALVREEDVVIDDETPAGVARGLPGRAFCPTPRALELLRRAGAEPEPHPSVEALRRVNGRAFASGLGPTLPCGEFVITLETARGKVASDPTIGPAWRAKRAYGMAGRGQRVIARGLLAGADLAFVEAALREGGLQLEPQVAIEEELAIHGMLAESGALHLGTIVRQVCDARGVWRATEPIASGRLDEDVARALRGEASEVGRALHDAGYFGPFGIDAFRYRDLEGALRLQSRSEINARYSMGFAIGFGEMR